ncbi:MAG: PA domain-containing protein [Rhodanobacter sp.]
MLFSALMAAGLLGVASYASAADITISNQDVGTGQGLDDPTPATPVGGNPGTTRGEQAQIVFQFAADIWGAVLQSQVPVTVSASFAKLDCDATSGVLGSAGTINIYAFNAPVPTGALANTWYHSALADALNGSEMGVAGAADIRARFNGALGSTGCLEGSNWYFGLDGKQPVGSIDFLNVVLHEMAHGLGFSGFGNVSTGVPLQNRQDIYSTFVFDDTQQSSWYGMSVAQRIASAKNDGNLVFTGKNVKEQAPLALGKPMVLHISAPTAAVGDYSFSQSGSPIPATPTNFSGSIVVAVTGVNNEGCAPFDNAVAVTGHVVLIDRGTCAFDVKATNAIAAGASGVIIANNAAGTIVPAITVNMPVISVTQAVGTTFKANRAGLTGALALGTGIAGADADGNVQLYAPTTVAPGSSFSHYDTRLTPNAIMEYAISADLAGQIDLDLTPALFQDEGWVINSSAQSLLDCNTTIPTWVPGGVVIGANVIANAKIIADVSPAVGDYRTGVRNYAATLATDNLVTSGQATALNACLNDAETLKQWKAWSSFAPVDIAVGVPASGQSGKAQNSKVYTLVVPAGALALSLRSLGGTGDVSMYVKVGSAATPTTYTWKSVHPRTNSETVSISRPAAGTYYVTIVGETDYTGVTVLGSFRAL